MDKTKFGVSVCLIASLFFMMALMGTNVEGLVIVLAAATYLFATESNAFLRKSIVKAIALLLVFYLASNLVGMVSDIFTFVNEIIKATNSTFRLKWPFNLDGIINSAIEVVRTITFLVLALLALKGQSFKIGPVDDMVDKYTER